jgi:hypothetical protein
LHRDDGKRHSDKLNLSEQFVGTIRAEKR